MLVALDAAIPYRAWTSEDLSVFEKIGYTALTPIAFLPANIIVKIFQLPYYLVRDISQIFLIPGAVIYYYSEEEK